MSSPDVVIVGGGVVGAACAYELALTGRDVMIVERGADWASGCSGGNAGLICPSHSRPLASAENLRFALRHLGRPASPLRVAPQPGLFPWMLRFLAAAVPHRATRNTDVLSRLALAGRKRWRELSDAGAVQGLCQKGLLYSYASDGAFARATAEATFSAPHHPASPEVLDQKAVRELVPALSHTAGGLYFADECHGDPLLLTQSLGDAAIELGARFMPNTSAATRRTAAGTIELIVGDHHLRPNHVIAAAGVATRDLLRPLGFRLPLLAGRGYAVDVLREPAFEIPVYLYEERVVATPLLGRTRLAGTLELVSRDREPDRRRVLAVRKAGAKVGLAPTLVTSQPWTGLRPCAPDGLPLVGEIAGLQGFIVATGHAMLGLTLGPSTGELVRKIVNGDELPPDLSNLSPMRYLS